MASVTAPAERPGFGAPASRPGAPAQQQQQQQQQQQPGAQVVAELSQQWALMSAQQKQLAGVIALVAIFIARNFLVSAVGLVLVCYYLSLRKPQPETFAPFFEAWYKTQYYPQAASKLEAELHARANQKANRGDVLSSLGDHFKGWLQASTKGLQADVLCSMIMRNPLLFEDRGVFWSVSVNLGSQEQPCVAVFWGIHEMWLLAPYYTLDFSNTSILNAPQ